MRIVRLMICMLAVLLSTSAWAEGDVSFTGRVQPNVVTVGSRFNVIYTLENASNGEFREGECEGIDKLYGPSTSTSSSVQIINGEMTKSVSQSYQLVYRASKVGEFSISPAVVVLDGKRYTSNTLKITVVESAANTNTGESNGNTQSKGAASDLMVRQTLNKQNVYEGEAVVLTTKIYTRINLSEISGVTPPQLAEFVAQEQFEGQLVFNREVVDGTVYNAAISSQKVLIPQKNGKIKIDPIEYDFVVKERVSSGGGFFGGFFDDVQLTRRKTKSNTLTLNVKPLPEGKPSGFSGGVGDFKMNVSVSPSQVEVDNSVQVKVTISGEGNLKLLSLPKPVFHQDFDTFDPSESQKLTNTLQGEKGSRTAEYLIIPRVAGEFEIPAVKFTYFNVAKGKYETLSQGPFAISVAKGEGHQGQNSGVVVSANNGSAVVYTGKDLRYLRVSDTELQEKGEFFVLSPLFFALCGGLVVLFVAVILYNLKQRQNSREVDRVRMRRANKAARKRLKVAAKLMKENKREAFFDEVMRALWGYLSDKLTLPLSELTKDNAKEQMQQHNIEPSTADEFMKLLDDCEFARYAPANMVRPMDEIFHSAEDVIGKIDGYIK